MIYLKVAQDFIRKEYIYQKPKSHQKITMGNTTIFFNEIKHKIESIGVKNSKQN